MSVLLHFRVQSQGGTAWLKFTKAARRFSQSADNILTQVVQQAFSISLVPFAHIYMSTYNDDCNLSPTEESTHLFYYDCNAVHCCIVAFRFLTKLSQRLRLSI